ncbi:alpha/beta hydrolase [Streptomyces physcomitrii]|uniref:Alpha/beta fold hydrolase n=1 Tax=Streptomyces physcomitrii TaxID=2724184 RepID=A0ABX1GYN7_9ACTN|nr:alpha/beta fold hydrolase [Streptomyces physcomitrii]NKI41192.1 alpha/beta fold hydrolase [Streptomyces physcomitrii]
MRTVTATAATVSAVLGVGAAALAAGRLASEPALRAEPGRPLPTEPRLTVHAAGAGRIMLTRSLASLRPGVFGLTGDGCHAVTGPVLEADPASPADTVVRRLDAVTHGSVRSGTRVRFTPQVYRGDPLSALGLDYADVDVPGELGDLPAWFVPAPRTTWVIAVHGLGTTREHPMVLMEQLQHFGLPVLALSYRGDLGAPRNPDGVSRLGEREWRDVDAAIRYAVRYGAERVILLGWSTGAAMALHAVTHSPLRERVVGLVLDSPVLSWQAALRGLAAARRTPAPILPLAVRAAQGRAGLRGDGLAAGAAAALDTPTLLFHSPEDRLAPYALSLALAERRPDLVSLHTVPRASHAALWNAAPAEYEEALRRFLTPLV